MLLSEARISFSQCLIRPAFWRSSLLFHPVSYISGFLILSLCFSTFAFHDAIDFSSSFSFCFAIPLLAKTVYLSLFYHYLWNYQHFFELSRPSNPHSSNPPAWTVWPPRFGRYPSRRKPVCTGNYTPDTPVLVGIGLLPRPPSTSRLCPPA